MLIPIYLPKVHYNDDPSAWKSYYTSKELRQKQCRSMYTVDKNKWSYVYGLVKNGEILYVGLSDTPYKRYKSHLRGKLEYDWEVELTLLGKGIREEMKIVERQMIKKYKPPLNIDYVEKKYIINDTVRDHYDDEEFDKWDKEFFLDSITNLM
jgi:predicted GIY-YIG superfamily endonuclease